jgi:hypothetical protein
LFLFSVNRCIQVKAEPSSRAESVVSVLTTSAFVATGDGSVDFRGRPANKTATGRWRTAPTLFGECAHVQSNSENIFALKYCHRVVCLPDLDATL